MLYFTNQRFSQLKFPEVLTTVSSYTPTWISGSVLDFPPTLTNLANAGSFWLNMVGTGKIVILRSATPPTVADSYQSDVNMNKIATIYIPTEYMDTYKAHARWGNATLVAKMQPLEGSKYEVFNEWEYDD